MTSTAPFPIQRSRAFFLLSPAHTHTLRVNFVWNAAGIIVFSLSQWGILAAFAKLGTPALVGRVVYGLALTTPIFVIASLQLRQIQATDTNNRHRLSQYLGLRVLTTGAAIILIALLVGCMTWSAEAQLSLIVVLWTLAKTFDAGSDALYGLFQQYERMDYVGLSLILRGLLALASVAVLLRASHSAPIALAGLVVSWSAVFILFDMPMARILIHQRERQAGASDTISELLRPVFDRRQLAPLCLEAAPLGVVAFLFAVQAQIPRYVIAGLLHTRDLGLFSAAAYLTFVGAALVNALGAPASVRLAQYYAAGERSRFRQLMTKMLLLASALGIAGILVSVAAGSRILALLYTNEYSQMAAVLTLLCVGSAISYAASFFGYGMTSLRRYRIQVPIFVGVVLATVLSCYWLTGRYGMMGTAAGVLVGNLVQLFLSAAVVLRTEWPDLALVGAGVRATQVEAEC
jgi:O-antigen/teichoic acid export membrane protein